MRSLGFGFALACAAALLGGCGPVVPPAANYAVVSGLVYDAQTSAPIAGAVVTIDGLASAPTGADGMYKVTDVPFGSQIDYSAVAPNYRTVDSTSGPFVNAGQQLNFSIALTHV
ncbi:MAG: carboxypeptidase regulatory-like domain-containing protein [Vulcanimicrobiaceae bacterium]